MDRAKAGNEAKGEEVCLVYKVEAQEVKYIQGGEWPSAVVVVRRRRRVVVILVWRECRGIR